MSSSGTTVMSLMAAETFLALFSAAADVYSCVFFFIGATGCDAF